MKTIYIALGNRATNILYEFRNNRMSETNQFLYLDSDQDTLSCHGKSIRETVTLTDNFNFQKNLHPELRNIIFLCCLGEIHPNDI